MKLDIFNKLGFSKRHLTTLATAAVILLNKKLGLDLEEGTVKWLVGLVLGYVAVDTVGKFAGGGELVAWLQGIGRKVVKDVVRAANDAAPKDTEKVEPPKES